MTQRFIKLLCVIVPLCLVAANFQRTTKTDYTKFRHSSHAGRVRSLTITNKSAYLDCAYCHGGASKNTLDIENTSYPSRQYSRNDLKTHSACTECHAFTGPAAPRDMCTICHQQLEIDNKIMARNVRMLPNPNGLMKSQFFDNFSHATHVKYFDNKFDCKACHTQNTTPVLAGKMEYKNAGVRMSRPEHTQCFTCHLDPKIVSPPVKDKPDPKNTFATNCSGCHREQGAPFKNGRPAMGSEPAFNWFARQIIDTEFNRFNLGVITKQSPPFSHKSHDESVIGKKEKRAIGIEENRLNNTESCLVCHTTGKTANTISDFYLEDKKYKEKQPLAYSCVECHKIDGMQQKIEGNVTLENSKCNYCHSINTIRAMVFMGSEMPPKNHYYDYRALAKSTAPATDATAPPSPPPDQPVPQPVPVPVDPAASAESPSTAIGETSPMRTEYNGFKIVSPSGGKPQTMPAMPRLGDTKDNEFWGKSDKWGVVENFNHETHTQAKYSKSCQDCHHTNIDSREEMKRGLVPLCTSCHYDDSNPKNPKNKAGDEIDVELAYHGNADNTTNNAGCIECHRRYYDNKPDAERLAPTGKCAGCHTEKTATLMLNKYWIAVNLNKKINPWGKIK